MITTKSDREHPTILNDEQYASCWKITREFLGKHGRIRNRELREASGIGYDQAIGFFNRALKEKRVERHGAGGSTHYVIRAK